MILDDDEEHRAMQRIKGTCTRTVARRLYVRGYYISGNFLLSHRYSKEERKKALRQKFVPIGVICLTCGHTRGSPSAALNHVSNRAWVRYNIDEMNRGLDKVYGTPDFNKSLNEHVLKSKNDLEELNAKTPRAKKRRLQREEEKKQKRRERLGINEAHTAG